MKQQHERDTFKSAVQHAYSLWRSGLTINRAVVEAAKHYKVNEKELGKSVLEYAKNESKE